MTRLTVDQAFAMAAQALQSGRTPEAAHMLRAVLRVAPEHADALYHLGVACRRLGQFQAARTLMRQAVCAAPANAAAYANKASLAQDAGLPQEAAADHRRTLIISPDMGIAVFNRAAFHQSVGDSRAAAGYRQALILLPAFAPAFANRGLALRGLGDADAAVASLRRAVICQADLTEAWCNLGAAKQTAGDDDAARRCYRIAAALRPDHADTWSNLATLGAGGDAPRSSAPFLRTLRLAPEHAPALAGLGLFLEAEDDQQGARAAFQRCLAAQPGYQEGYYNFGCTLYDRNDVAPASPLFERAAALNPDHLPSGMNVGMALLRMGDFVRGWPAYEARLRDREAFPRVFNRPQWRGEPLEGRTILLHVEQGFGDTLHFARYAPMVAARGGRVILEAQANLMDLTTGLPGVWRTVRKGDPLPDFDLHCPLLSLPLAFGTDLSSIPAAIPYLRADPVRVAAWAARLGRGDGLRVGLVWAGSATFKADWSRSPRLPAMLPLLAVPGVRFFALQMGDGRRDMEGRTMPACFTDLGPEIGDFADTAAIMENLDLVISSCTAPAHLAGALGRPTWIVTPFASDWRWLLDREDSPWYPSVRLFRQRRRGEWGEVIERVGAALLSAAEGGALTLLR